jgi:hypothetical protein
MPQLKKPSNKKVKKVPNKYKEKLVVNGTFEELMKELVITKGFLIVPSPKKNNNK